MRCPNGQEVVALWTGRADRFTVNQSEFFNRSIGRVLYTGAPTPGGLAETRVTRLARSGILVRPDGAPIVAPYALLDGSITPDGVVVARDKALGTTLWRLTGPLASTTTVTGLYPNDTWSGPVVTWKKLHCRPGRLVVGIHGDETLFPEGQHVDVLPDRGRRVRIDLPPGETVGSEIDIAPRGDGACLVRFVVTPTAVPAEVIPGSKDDRVLGAHFDSFVYELGPA